MKWMGGGEGERRRGGALKCLGKIILGRQSIFPLVDCRGADTHTQ